MEKFGKVCKEYIVKEIAQHFKDFPDFFITSSSQVKVVDIERLRKNFKRNSSVYMVVKNSMLRHAIEKSGKTLNIEEISPFIAGSCGILFSKADAAVIARSLTEFSKEHEGLKIQGAFVSGERMSSDTIKHLATLPPKDILLAMVVSGIKAPISGFVGLLGNLLRNLVGVIDAISKKKGES